MSTPIESPPFSSPSESSDASAASPALDWVSETTELTGLDADALAILEIDPNTSSEASSEAESSSTDSPGPYSPKRRKVRAKNTWQFSKDPPPNQPRFDRKNKRIFYCQYCHYTNTTTTNIRKYLRTDHGIYITEEKSLVRKATDQQIKSVLAKQGEVSQRQAAEKERAVLRSVIKKDVVQECIAQLVVMRNLSFNSAAWPELRALLLSVNPEAGDVLPSSHSSLPKFIFRPYDADKDLLKQKLRTAVSPIHLAIDVWSSPNRKNFLGIVAQFVDHSFRLRKALLALPWLPESHSAAAQEDPLWRTLEDYNIKDRIGYCVGDNHGSNDLLLRKLGDRLAEDRTPGAPQFDPKQRRIRCHGHVINLAVQAFFFCRDQAAVDAAFDEARQQLAVQDLSEDDVNQILQKRFQKTKTSKFAFRSMGVLGKIHNFAAHIRSSNERYNNFMQTAGQMVPLDNETRWNSWFRMLRTALDLRKAITKYQETNYRDFDDGDSISPVDWVSLKEVVEFLKPFERVTKEVEGDRSTLDSVLFTMDFLVNHYKTAYVSISRDSARYPLTSPIGKI